MADRVRFGVCGRGHPSAAIDAERREQQFALVVESGLSRVRTGCTLRALVASWASSGRREPLAERGYRVKLCLCVLVYANNCPSMFSAYSK